MTGLVVRGTRRPLTWVIPGLGCMTSDACSTWVTSRQVLSELLGCFRLPVCLACTACCDVPLVVRLYLGKTKKGKRVDLFFQERSRSQRHMRLLFSNAQAGIYSLGFLVLLLVWRKGVVVQVVLRHGSFSIPTNSQLLWEVWRCSFGNTQNSSILFEGGLTLV